MTNNWRQVQDILCMELHPTFNYVLTLIQCLVCNAPCQTQRFRRYLMITHVRMLHMIYYEISRINMYAICIDMHTYTHIMYAVRSTWYLRTHRYPAIRIRHIVHYCTTRDFRLVTYVTSWIILFDMFFKYSIQIIRCATHFFRYMSWIFPLDKIHYDFSKNLLYAMYNVK